MKHNAFQAKTDIRLISFGNRTEMIQTVAVFSKRLFDETNDANSKRCNEKTNGKRINQFQKFY